MVGLIIATHGNTSEELVKVRRCFQDRWMAAEHGL